MNVVTISILIIIALIVFISLILQNYVDKHKTKNKVRGDDLPIWPFDPMPIMTDTEVIFHKKLQQAIPEFVIFGQVQLSRIIEPNEEADSRSFWFNRICRQSIDYVVISQDLQTVLLAIELDDWTHNSQSRINADEKKDKALASAGIPVLRFNAEKMPSIEIIRKDITVVLEKYS